MPNDVIGKRIFYFAMALMVVGTIINVVGY